METNFDIVPDSYAPVDRHNIERILDNGDYARIHRYPDGTAHPGCRYCWQVHRGDLHVHGATDTLCAALDAAEAMLNGQIEIVIARQITDLKESLARTNDEAARTIRRLKALGEQTDDDFARGHKAGYLQGCKDERAALRDLIEFRYQEAA